MARRKADIVRDMPPLLDDQVENERPQLSTEERAVIAKDTFQFSNVSLDFKVQIPKLAGLQSPNTEIGWTSKSTSPPST